jgi:zinc protease
MSEAADPLQLERAEGPAGLAVVRQSPPPGAASFSATLVGPAGWGFDPADRLGLARVAGMLIPSGAGGRDRRALARHLDRLGATLTPRVDPESAEVTVWGPADAWGSLLGVLADAVLRPFFSADDFERVRRQLVERQLRELSQPGSRVDRELLRTLYPNGHPYRETGLGNSDSLKRIRPSDVERFRREHRSGPASLLVVTGAPPLSDLLRAARREFGELPAGPAPALPGPKLPRVRPREVRVELPDRSQVEIRIGGRSIPRADPSYPAAYLANEVLGGSMLLSRLFKRLRSTGGLAYHAASHLEAMRAGGYWFAQAGTGADRWRRVLPMMREEIARVGAEPVPGRELATVVRSRIGEVALSLETTAEAHELAIDAAYHGLPLDQWKRWPAILRGVSPTELHAAAEAALDLSAAVTVIGGPVARA